MRETLKGSLFNFLRTDLVDILYHKIKDHVEIRFSTSVREISQDAHSVKVIFDDGRSENFDLLIGADGIHSNVRQLTYSAEEVRENFLGYYVAGLDHSVPLKVKKGEVLSMLAPKRQLMTYTSGLNSSTSLFVFQSPRHGHLTTEEKVTILRKEFSAFVSPVTEILVQAAKEERLFFDEVTQIRIDGSWSKGRIVLTGDAAYCITLLSGQGASMAMTGAYVLAKKLLEADGNYNKAFEEYESDLRPFIERMQRNAVKNAATYLPATKFKLWIRNLLAPIVFTKLFSSLLIKQLGAGNFFAKN